MALTYARNPFCQQCSRPNVRAHANPYRTHPLAVRQFRHTMECENHVEFYAHKPGDLVNLTHAHCWRCGGYVVPVGPTRICIFIASVIRRRIDSNAQNRYWPLVFVGLCVHRFSACGTDVRRVRTHAHTPPAIVCRWHIQLRHIDARLTALACAC